MQPQSPYQPDPQAGQPPTAPNPTPQQPGQYPSQPGVPTTPYPTQPTPIAPQDTTQNPNNYDFILNPQAPPKQRMTLPGANSLLVRVSVVAGGIIVLLILFSIVKGLVGNSGHLSSYITVLQDQQEIIHLVSAAAQQQGTTTTTQNFAATAQLSVSSAQDDLIAYLSTNHKKVSSKQLNLKVSSSLDTQLTTAAAATTYDETFTEIMKDQLTTYTDDMSRVYKETSGKKGHALLSSDYNQAQLLYNQLTTAAGPGS